MSLTAFESVEHPWLKSILLSAAAACISYHCSHIGTTVRIERVSPEVIVLRPPKKLVFEVRVSGEYAVIFWFKGVLSQPITAPPQNFPNFFEIFVKDNTTIEDEGIYIVQPNFKHGTSSTHLLIPSGGVDFAVILPGM